MRGLGDLAHGATVADQPTDFKIISAIMGHSTIVITQDRYTHLSPADLAAAGARFEGFLAGRTGHGVEPAPEIARFSG
jgi:integrase